MTRGWSILESPTVSTRYVETDMSDNTGQFALEDMRIYRLVSL